MSALEVLTAGHPALRERARELSVEELRSPRIQRLIDDMIETMREHAGAGLAANQVLGSGSPVGPGSPGVPAAPAVPAANPGVPAAPAVPAANPGEPASPGVPVRIAVIEVLAPHPRYPYKPPIPLTVIVNPELSPLDDETFLVNEGCLSVPGLRGEVPRHVNLGVRFLDRHGEPREIVVRGLSAGTFQHEVDHLDGILFLDRVADPRSFMTWEEFDRRHREAFQARARALVDRLGS